MSMLRKVALVVLAITLATFVALFGRLPALRNTPIGYLNRAIFHTLPKAFRRSDEVLFRGRLTAVSTRVVHHLVNEKHPVVMILFLGLVTASAAMFLSSAWQQISLTHHLVIPNVVAAPYLFTWLCARSNNTHITSENLAGNLSLYPYDHVIYHPGVTCRTCNILKPARSKHCSICRACVPRLDHHCVWVNNCIGRENYRWFLALVASLSILLAYGAALGFTLMAPLLPPRKKEMGVLGYFDQWGIALAKDPKIGAVGLLAFMTEPLAAGLLAYHVYLIWAGTTTNETAKWSDLREDMADGLVWRGRRACYDHGRDVDVEIEPPTPWPVSSNQIIAKTMTGQSPGVDADGMAVDSENGLGSAWERCWSLSQVDNIYDLGFWDNLVEFLTV